MNNEKQIKANMQLARIALKFSDDDYDYNKLILKQYQIKNDNIVKYFTPYSKPKWILNIITKILFPVIGIAMIWITIQVPMQYKIWSGIIFIILIGIDLWLTKKTDYQCDIFDQVATELETWPKADYAKYFVNEQNKYLKLKQQLAKYPINKDQPNQNGFALGRLKNQIQNQLTQIKTDQRIINTVFIFDHPLSNYILIDELKENQNKIAKSDLEEAVDQIEKDDKL